MQNKRLSLYSIGHFLIDFTSAFLLLGIIKGLNIEMFIYSLLIYNFCAFALQLPIGIIGDNLNRNNKISSIGLIISAAAVLFSVTGLISQVIIISILLGAGDACYHVGAGIDTLNDSVEKQWRLGVFGSFGGLGLFVGGLLGGQILNTQIVPYMLVVGLLLLFAFILLGIPMYENGHSENVPFEIDNIKSVGIVVLLCMSFVVIINSYMSVAVSFSWQVGVWAVVCAIGIFIGKILGGVLSDKFGIKIASIISLLGSSVFFMFSSNQICGTIALLLFAMTVPMTLWVPARILPKAKGFSFGIVKFSIFLGAALYFFNVLNLNSSWQYAFWSVLSAVAMFIGLRDNKSIK